MDASATINGELRSGSNVTRISGPFSTPHRADTWNVSFATLGKTQAVETVFPETAQSVINQKLNQGWKVEMEASPGKFTPQGRMGWFIIFER